MVTGLNLMNGAMVKSVLTATLSIPLKIGKTITSIMIQVSPLLSAGRYATKTMTVRRSRPIHSFGPPADGRFFMGPTIEDVYQQAIEYEEANVNVQHTA